jgi:hypothetical protein
MSKYILSIHKIKAIIDTSDDDGRCTESKNDCEKEYLRKIFFQKGVNSYFPQHQVK